MPIVEWSSNFLLGVPEFDAHHEHLVGLINTAYDDFVSSAPVAGLESIIGELFDYAGYHFAAEEHMMIARSYPKLAEHKAEHDSFFRNVAAFQKDFLTGRATLSTEIFSFLVEWLTNHILVSDADYGRFLAENRTTS